MHILLKCTQYIIYLSRLYSVYDKIKSSVYTCNKMNDIKGEFGSTDELIIPLQSVLKSSNVFSQKTYHV